MRKILILISIALYCMLSWGLNYSKPISAPIINGNISGTAFRIKYKGIIYIISAGHVCGNNTEMFIQGHKVRVLDSRLDEVDQCILSNNLKVKLPILPILLDLNAKVGPVFVDAYHYEDHINKRTRDVHSGYIKKALKAGLVIRPSRCESNVECISVEYYPNAISTTAIAVRGNSGGPVVDKLSGKVLGIVIQVNSQSQSYFSPIQFVLDKIDNKLPAKDPLEIEQNISKVHADQFCKSKNILSKPLFVRTGYKSYNIFCRKNNE